MHYLLKLQIIIDEIVRLVQAQGFKALEEARFDHTLLFAPLSRYSWTNEEIGKWLAYLHIEGYIRLTADDHHRNPTFIILTPKGMSAETSKYFKEKYDQKKWSNIKYWIEVPSLFVVGVTAIIALLISGSESCNKSKRTQYQVPSINIYNTISDPKLNPTHRENKLLYDTVAKKLFYLDTFYIGVDTVFVEK